jgi:hypothetical protein
MVFPDFINIDEKTRFGSWILVFRLSLVIALACWILVFCFSWQASLPDIGFLAS